MNYPQQPKNPPRRTICRWIGGQAGDITTYELEDGSGYVVADGDGWLDGAYDSHTTARDAAMLGYGACKALNELSRVTGRVITLGDVNAWKAGA